MREVGQQAGDRPVDGPGVPGVVGLEVAVLVPVAVAQLDEPDARLDEPPGQQALAAEVGGLVVVDPVEGLGRVRLPGQVHHLGQRPLHPEGQLVRLDDPLDAGVDPLALEQLAVHRLDEVELEPLGVRVEPGVLDVAEPGRRRRADLVADPRPLVDRRQEGAAVVLRAAVAGDRLDGDEAGQVLVLGPQAVERPGPQRGPDELRAARVHHQVGLRVRGEVGVHAPDRRRARRRGAATSGNSSEIHRPLWPCWRNFQGEPSSFAPASRPTGEGLSVSAVSRGL